MIKIEILNQQDEVKKGKNDYEEEERLLVNCGDDFCDLATQDLCYELGDKIKITTDKPKSYLAVKLDETLDTTIVYLPETQWIYYLGLTANAGEAQVDTAFTQRRHYLKARYATTEEIASYRNWALNPHDQKEFHGAYPHAHANVETRNDATFFACNAIDGIFANQSHGAYPYQSWGINRQADAALTIDFGRLVELNQVGLTLRADYPHDSHWEQVALLFSDGSKEVFKTKGITQRQLFKFAPRTTVSVTLCDLIKAEDDSPFPALTELELFGINVEK